MASVPLTLYRYIGKQFLLNLLLVLGVMMGLILVIDTVELIRRGSEHGEMTTGIILRLSFLKLPSMAQRVLPFAVLIGGMLCFSRLTRTRELIVARSAGISAWQFITPSLIVAVSICVLMIGALSPLTSTMLLRYEQLEARYLKGRTSLLTVSSSGLWLRQHEEDPEGKLEGADTIIHALRVSAKDMRLFDVIIFTLGNEDKFLRRVDAESAQLRDGYWLLDGALVTAPETTALRYQQVTLPTRLTVNQIQESFAPPETLSFWALPSFIRNMEASGFAAQRHRLYWYSLMAMPLLMCAMVLVGAVFALKYRRVGSTGMLIIAGASVGFGVYFLSDLIGALALSGTMPPALAAWSIASVATVVGVITLLHQEDG